MEVLWQRGRNAGPTAQAGGKESSPISTHAGCSWSPCTHSLEDSGSHSPVGAAGRDCGIIAVTLHQDPTWEDLVTGPQETLAFSSEKWEAVRGGRGKCISEFQTSQDYVQRPCLTKQKAGWCQVGVEPGDQNWILWTHVVKERTDSH